MHVVVPEAHLELSWNVSSSRANVEPASVKCPNLDERPNISEFANLTPLRWPPNDLFKCDRIKCSRVLFGNRVNFIILLSFFCCNIHHPCTWNQSADIVDVSGGRRFVGKQLSSRSRVRKLRAQQNTPRNLQINEGADTANYSVSLWVDAALELGSSSTGSWSAQAIKKSLEGNRQTPKKTKTFRQNTKKARMLCYGITGMGYPIVKSCSLKISKRFSDVTLPRLLFSGYGGGIKVYWPIGDLATHLAFAEPTPLIKTQNNVDSPITYRCLSQGHEA